MKNKKLIIILISAFAIICLVVGGVVAVFSQLEKNPIDEDDTIVRRSGNNALVFRDEKFVTGNILTANDESLKKCILMLNDQLGIKEVYASKYAPLSGEVKTRYYYRNSGNILYEKTTLEKSRYQRTAYSKQTFTLPSFKLENIKKINICYGSYYDSTNGYTIDGICDFFPATVDGDCPTFNIMKLRELSQEKEILDFVNEFKRTGSLKDSYNNWSEYYGKSNLFFQVFFADSSVPVSLLFTKEAINAH